MEAEIIRNPHEAQMGGVPSVLNKVRAFLNVRYLRNNRWQKDNLEVCALLGAL